MAMSSRSSQSSLAVVSSPKNGDEGGDVNNSKEHQQFHRYVSVERLGAYSDAVFSIIITFMVIPLTASVEEMDIKEDIKKSLVSEWRRFLIYVISYFFVFAVWENHVRLYEVVEHVGDVVIVINVIQLLIASMLPFATALLSDYYEDPLGTVIFACCLATISLLQISTVIFAYRQKKMMKEGIRKREVTIEFCASAGVLLCFSSLSAAITYFNQIAAWIILFLAIFAEAFSVMLVAVYKRFHPDDKHDTTKKYIWHRLITRRSNPDRIQNFTDGVFAIVATLIILDLTTVVSNATQSGREGIQVELEKEKEIFLAYFATFSTVGMIWYTHYTVFHAICKINRLTSLLNKWVLLFIGILPMGFKLIANFSDDTWDRNENTAVQFNCAIIFGASVFQLLAWLSGHWKRYKHFHESYNKVHISWCLLLCLVYPCMSFILFLVAFAPGTRNADAIQAIQISIPLLFCLIKIGFEIYMNRKPKYKETVDVRETVANSQQLGKNDDNTSSVKEDDTNL